MQIVSTLSAVPKAPTAPLLSVMPAKFQVLWLAKRILLAGDVESNSGPTSVCVARPHAGAVARAHVLNHTTSPRATGITILQVHINDITNKQEELKQLAYTTQPDIITIQETKLTTTSKTPKITNYTHIRTDREARRRTTHRH